MSWSRQESLRGKRVGIAVVLVWVTATGALAVPYPIVDTGQGACYDTINEIGCPESGQNFFGQDAQFDSLLPAPSYRDNGDGTISDLSTGLMWVKARGLKMSWNEAMAGADTCTVGSYADWRAPTIKELYSLILFSGFFYMEDPSVSIPFLDTSYFDYEIGDTAAGDRWIDCQDWSATPYVGLTMGDDTTIFGVNFADGRIKGYPKYHPFPPYAEYELYIRYVRGNESYGANDFEDNGDHTIRDTATGLLWSKYDSQTGLNWQEALAWVAARNAENYLGYSDWRLPNAKEMQSIVDYTRAPDVTGTPAINPVFEISEISTNEYPYFWTSTTIGEGMPGSSYHSAVYLCFGRALGWMNIGGQWQLLDVHGAGAQRAEFKSGNPNDYPHGRGPQGDVVRIYNYVRLVRGQSTAFLEPVGDVTVLRVGATDDVWLNWSEIPGAVLYRIYRSTEPSFPLNETTLIGTSTINRYTDMDAVLLPGTEYFYCVTASAD